MSEGKVLSISPDDAKYLDPTQIASIQMVDGTTVVIKGNEEEFAEEVQQDEQQYQTQEVQGQEGQKLRGRGLIGALAGAAAGAALLGTAAAIGGGMRRPYYGRYGYGYGYGMRPMIPPPPPPMMRPRMFGPRFY